MTGKGWEVEVSYDLVRDLARGHVQYQGKLYPGEFSARCRRSHDGLEVVLKVRVTDQGAEPMSATIRREGGIGGVSRLPLVSLARIAAGEVAFDPKPTAGTWSWSDPAVDELQLVADFYREALQVSNKPIPEYIADKLEDEGIYRAPSTVSKLIHKARRTEGPDGQTYLPPTEPGRKKA